jgi:hypothetical protein
MREDIFLTLVEDHLIPLQGHLGQHKVDGNGEEYPEERLYRLARRYYHSTIPNLPKGREFYVSVGAWNRGLPERKLASQESGRDANMQVLYPGPLAQRTIDNVFVVPNPYRGSSSFDGRLVGDYQGDRSRRLWFVNLPARANVQIFSLAGDLVDEFEHYPGKVHEIISVSREVPDGVSAGGIHPWNLLSRHNQIIASGLYFFSVKCHDSGNVQVGRFAVIR